MSRSAIFHFLVLAVTARMVLKCMYTSYLSRQKPFQRGSSWTSIHRFFTITNRQTLEPGKSDLLSFKQPFSLSKEKPEEDDDKDRRAHTVIVHVFLSSSLYLSRVRVWDGEQAAQTNEERHDLLKQKNQLLWVRRRKRKRRKKQRKKGDLDNFKEE